MHRFQNMTHLPALIIFHLMGNASLLSNSNFNPRPMKCHHTVTVLDKNYFGTHTVRVPVSTGILFLFL